MKYLFCPILIFGLLIFISGCGEDSEPILKLEANIGPPPEVISTVPITGGSHGGHSPVVFTLNKALAEANVVGAVGTTAIQGTNVVFTGEPLIPAGPVTLTLIGIDAAGQEVTYALAFTAVGIDIPIEFVGELCKPRDGATDVDPGEYTEGLEVVFHALVGLAEVISTKPDFDFTLNINGSTVEIRFQDYTMPYDTKFEINISVAGLEGSMVNVTYSFTTMAKAEI